MTIEQSLSLKEDQNMRLKALKMQVSGPRFLFLFLIYIMFLTS